MRTGKEILKSIKRIFSQSMKFFFFLCSERPSQSYFSWGKRKTMRNFLASILEKISEKLRGEKPKASLCKEKNEVENSSDQSQKLKKAKKKSFIGGISPYKRSLRDFAEMMENPFLALSKNRRNPIIYESPDGTRKIKVTRHTGHFLASIYDWDIIIFVGSKIQEIFNSGLDIPPRTIIFPRHEILKYLHRHDGKKQHKDLENSLHRLKRTAIDTTIRNEDGRYKADFGFIDSWEYTERKDKKEIKITLSQWLYDGICAQGVLLKVAPAYFDLTSALKRFLYRTARKHAGNSEDERRFSIEKLYKKSGSEQEFKKFKSDLKFAVKDNNIPEYSIKWVEKNGKAFVVFKRSKIHELERLAEEIEKEEEKPLLSNGIEENK